MRSPVLFLIFKREDTTKRVFERIREAQPPKLYIAADGPRASRPEEKEQCEQTRKITESIDWPCEVHRSYRDENLGCGKGVSSAISWFFENEEEGIIIEDDVLPHPDFFKYCDEMLEKYRDDKSIHLIAGRNSFFDEIPAHESSYFFSTYMMIWGWASWRRVWKTYQFDLSSISKADYSEKLKRYPKKVHPFFWNIYNTMQLQECDTWDHQFFVNMVMNERYCIIPFTNMTENLGMGSADGTHSPTDAKRTNHKSKSPYPLIHPFCNTVDSYADYIHAKNEGLIYPHIFVRTFCFLKRWLGFK